MTRRPPPYAYMNAHEARDALSLSAGADLPGEDELRDQHGVVLTRPATDDDVTGLAGYAEHVGLREVLRNELTVGYCALMGLPMSRVDGRPWVETHDQAHLPEIWGNGTDPADGGRGCGHPDCDDTAGRNLRGILTDPGIHAYEHTPAERALLGLDEVDRG